MVHHVEGKCPRLPASLSYQRMLVSRNLSGFRIIPDSIWNRNDNAFVRRQVGLPPADRPVPLPVGGKPADLLYPSPVHRERVAPPQAEAGEGASPSKT